MKYKNIHVIANPASAAGTTGKQWKKIEQYLSRALGHLTYHMTEGPNDATIFSGSAVDDKADLILVIGGDGTLSEVVNGILQKKAGKKVAIAIINQGTGGDFSRTLGISTDLRLSVDQIRRGMEIKIDAGHLEYQDHGFKPASRYFINICGSGMAGEVVHRLNQSMKRFGAFSYYIEGVKTLGHYKNQRMRIIMDDREPLDMTCVTVAVCNGQFFGGGMQIAPGAELTDGLFDVVVINDWSILRKIMNSRSLYNGTIRSVDGVKNFQAREVTIEPVRDNQRVRIDSDGDNPGFIGMKARILPEALRLVR